MQKKYFYNDQLEIKNKDKKKPSHAFNRDIKRVVDINILLNRVKIEKQTEVKRKTIFYTSVVLMLSFIITFITIIK
jgi:hypothetical protein|tara:strand:- start:246 stop:473 length:228 start_codon:yes stop_codon:yes gene_type:complete